MTREQLYSAYTDWCEREGETADRGGVFARKLTERGYALKLVRMTGSPERRRIGLRLKAKTGYRIAA